MAERGVDMSQATPAHRHDPKLLDEAGPLASLNRYCVLDSANEAQFDRITELVRSVFQVPIAVVSLADMDRQWFKSSDGLDLTQTPRDKSFGTHAIHTGEALNIADASADPRFAENPMVVGEPHIGSYLGAPLVSPDGYHLGVLCAIDRRPRVFGPEEEALLAGFAALVVDELELRIIAQSDFLTGAKTRRAFMADLESACRHADQPASLLVIDIDHFKAVNDRHGHPVGDKVLRAAASAFRRVLRRSDTVGRLGGEEFGIILRGLDVRRALDCAERLRAAIAALRFAFAPELRVTASFGVTQMRPDDPAASLIRADTALYRAKNGGRNQVIAAGPAA